MPITLEKDPYLNRPENYIVEEQVTLDNTTGRIFKLEYGCFFGINLVVRKVGDPNPLRPMIDFTALHMQKDAVKESGREVLTVIRSDLANWQGDYLVSYHAYGGEYSTNAAIIQSLIDNEGGDLENVPWGSIVGKPDEYNPAAHTHVVSDDILKWNDMVSAVDRLADAVRAGGVESIDAIFNYLDIRFGAVSQEITTAIGTHNAALGVHSKEAVGLGQLSNIPATDKAKLNAGSSSYLTYQFLRQAVGLSFNNGIRSVGPGAITEPVAVISTTISELSGTVQNYIIIQGSKGSQVTEVTTPRWQVAICISAGARGAMGVRERDETSWSAWKRTDVGKLSNVPNFAAAELDQPDSISGTTSVDDKLTTPVVAKTIAQNVAGGLERVIYSHTSITETVDFVDMTFPDELAGKQMRVDFTAVAAASSAGDFVNVTAISSASGGSIATYTLPSWAGPFAAGQPLPFSGSFTFTVPTTANKTVRFSADHDGTTSTPLGAFVRIDAYRI